MFSRQRDEAEPPVAFTVDGERFFGRATDSVAAAMLLNGKVATKRAAVSGSLRAPYCMMGVCFECLVAIDGIGNRQACLVRLREGMVIETGSNRRGVPA